jgi:hypothetical protein
MTSRRRRTTVVAALLIGVAVNPLWSSAVRADDKDGDVVYCLSTAQRASLVDTAVILGLPGSSALSSTAPAQDSAALETWRKNHSGDFDRACSALAAAAQLEKSGRATGPSRLQNVLTVLLPALIGSAITWMFALQLATLNNRQTQAASLRIAAKQFDREAVRLVEARAARTAGAAPSEEKFRDARSDLGNWLEQISALHRRWREPEGIRTALDGPDLTGALAARRFDATGDELDNNRKSALTAIHGIVQRTERVALAVQRPGRPHPSMWRADTDPVDRAALPAGGGNGN